MIPELWLEEFNARMAAEGIPHKGRPFKALSEWTRTHPVKILMNSEEATAVFEWFYKNSPARSHEIGPLFTGIFYFDAIFWAVEIPIIYGTTRVNPLKSMSMPAPIFNRFVNAAHALEEYLAVWADCADFGFGHSETNMSKRLDPFGANLFSSARREVEANVSLLRESRPNHRAMESARMAVEMFLKSYISAYRGLDDKGAKRLGHDINACLSECLQIAPQSELQNLGPDLNVFRPIGTRYDALQFTGAELWKGHRLAMTAGVIIVRSLTGRDIRPTFKQD